MNTETLLVLIVVGLILIYLIYKNQNNSERLDNVSTDVSTSTQNTSQNNKKVLGVYYTNWCGYSRHFLSDLENGLQKELENHVTVKLFDCEKDENKELCNKLGVRGYPAIILHTENDNIMYNGDRSSDDLIKFVQH